MRNNKEISTPSKEIKIAQFIKENLLIIKSPCIELLGAFVSTLKKYKRVDVYKNKGVSSQNPIIRLFA